MVVKISDMPEALVLNETDEIEIEQAGVSKKITKQQLRSLLFNTSPSSGDVVVYNGTDFVPTTPVPPELVRWTVIDQIAYTESAPATSSTITFNGGLPSGGVNRKAGEYFSIGLPVRVEIGAGVFYYGICTAVTDTLLAMSGAILPISPIISLAFGKLEMVRHVQMSVPAVTYNTPGSLVKGCIHRWRGAPGHLVAYSCSHMNTSGTTVVNMRTFIGDFSVSGVIPAAGTLTTHGAFVDSALGDLNRERVIVLGHNTIVARVATTGGLADFLIINMTFVVP